ncbi:MAG: short-chain dehydrogenase [Cycloclasticus sp. symbiont of Bathymodiolus heckerae]|nr:MAG: short-chain dehydrogenase [Cycloclasticus sp. symbiont of Bathymodiolus heckerae]
MLKNKNILVTGGSRGIGKAIKKSLECKGANCISPSRNELDISSLRSIEAFFASLDVELDGLVNNAGINIVNPVEAINDVDTEKMIKTNLIAPLKLIQYAVKGMRKKPSGRVVNISSIWGVRSKEHRSLYSLTKFGLNGITRALARELGPDNIMINSVAPGYVNTEMTNQNISSDTQKEIVETIPLGRFASPDEIAKLVLFLLSDDNTYITGQTIVIDGGFLA